MTDSSIRSSTEIHSETKAHVIYTCKACKKSGRGRVAQRITYRIERIGTEIWYLGRISRHGRKRWFLNDQEVLSDSIDGGYTPPLPCPTCGHAMHGESVRGRHNPNIRCSPKCQSATGPNCECSCAGQNHGRSHA